MLQLQRASAGSGKTYTLAKQFIWFLIAIKEKERGGKWRLRNSREIADGLRRILAITFTNKATNEMKQRIVEKLADLARADAEYPLSEEQRKKIDYLNDFAERLGIDYREIGRSAGVALSVLLNEYSDFKVSTIDSFFQTVLRTFAYESNLNDTYQVEIDNDYVAAAAVNATLAEIDTSDLPSTPRFWINCLMDGELSKGTKNWNVFQKSPTDTSIYTRLLSSVKRLENEDFKKVREKLDEYFDNPDISDPLRLAYTKAVEAVYAPVEKSLADAKKAGAKLKRLFAKHGLDPAETGLRFMAGHLEKLPAITPDTSSSKLFSPINMDGKTSVFKTVGKSKQPVASTPDDALMLQTASLMYESYSRFLELISSSDWLHWKVYAPQIPYLGLIGVSRAMMKEYLDANNTIQLGETNSMLRRIIGEDDAPFIYERLGAHLNHFLIDEFQDTSRLQWENLLPLLHESDGRGEDNLIIGDAKQSIYRFRNADPSLITDAVPREFPERKDAGMSREENTNWRSRRTIVEFNNIFFHMLMQRVAELSEEVREGSSIPPTVDFRNLYSNVAQYPAKRERAGYIEVNFLEAPETRTDEQGRIRRLSSEEKTSVMRDEALSRIGPLIRSLIDRGYRQSDIAILVRVNSLAKAVIEALVDYNNTIANPADRIEFISEESLLVSSSDAVGIIIGILSKMAEGNVAPVVAKDKEGEAVKSRWSEIQCDFIFYAMRHPGMSAAEQVRGFLNEDTHTDAVNAMLRSMQTVALPALVEAITENFVPEDLRRSQAVFIAALQDMVLEYTESHPADLSSFIDWWRTKGVARSISSPEGTDAVQIMTIHKSKGLEFKCVIIPFDDTSIIPQKKSEWKWVRPAEKFISLGFPPFIPVATEPALRDTEHRDIYFRFFDLSSMDMLNAYYVAFTRAVDELYIFTRQPAAGDKNGKKRKKASTLGSCLNEFFTHDEDSLFAREILEDSGLSEELRSLMLPEDLIEWNEDASRLTIGSHLPSRSIRPEETSQVSEPLTSWDSPSGAADRQDPESTATTGIIDIYHVDSSPSVLQYIESPDGEGETATQMPEAEDTDPRSEGNLLHSILSMVKVPADLHRAILRHKMRGLISSSQAEEWEEFLAEAISRKEVRGWFAPGWRVLNERDMLYPGKKNRRPDRVLISPDRKSGVVIDYKFGDIPTGNSHKKQLKEYLEGFREILHIHNVVGYIWYLRKHHIETVLP